MRVDVIPITELSTDMRQRWLDIQAANPNLSGPCFHPDLFIAAGIHSRDVYVALLYAQSELTGFLPFLKDHSLSVAKPIDFCDYQAIIGPTSFPWDLKIILRALGLKAWHYESLADFEHIQSRGRQLGVFESRRIDLTGGYEDYRLSKKDGKIKFGGLGRKKKLMEAHCGVARFVASCTERDVMRQMLFWKSLQHQCDADWTKLATGLVELFCFSRRSSLGGVLSGLYAGNDLLAAFFGLRHQGILHALICAFNPDFKKFSPGLIMWQNLISSNKLLQYDILDLGPGDNKYKSYFANSGLPVMRQNCTDTAIKERIKSVKWLYRGLDPLVQGVREIMR